MLLSYSAALGTSMLWPMHRSLEGQLVGHTITSRPVNIPKQMGISPISKNHFNSISAATIPCQVNTDFCYCCYFNCILLPFILDKPVFTLLVRNFGCVCVNVFLLTVGIPCLVCHAVYNNFPLKF